MASKMITVRQDVYERLRRQKRGNESFSDVILRLLDDREKNPLRHFGIGASIPSEVHDTFEEGMRLARERARARSKARHDAAWDDPS